MILEILIKINETEHCIINNMYRSRDCVFDDLYLEFKKNNNNIIPIIITMPRPKKV